MEKYTLKVPGMMCMHCVAGVTDALNNADGISEVKVELSSKTVTFCGDKQTAIEAIDAIGFDV